MRFVDWGSPTPMHAFAASLSDSMMLSSSDRKPATHHLCQTLGQLYVTIVTESCQTQCTQCNAIIHHTGTGMRFVKQHIHRRTQVWPRFLA